MPSEEPQIDVVAERLPLERGVRNEEAEALSARRIQLVKDAHLRAEHQAHARSTMLELAEALEQARFRRKELEEAVALEQNEAAKVKDELALWPKRFDELKQKWESTREKVAYWGVKASAREGAAFPLLLTLALEWRPIGERRSVTGKPLSTEESLKVDRLLLKEMLKSWYSQVSEPAPGQPRRNSVHPVVVEVQKNDEAERLAKLLEEEREKNRALMAQLSTKAEEVKVVQRRFSQLEDERDKLLEKAEKDKELLKAEIEKLKADMAGMPALLAKKEEVITILKQENSEEKENTLRVKAEAEEERQRLLDRIQQLADELQSALTTAKHMKEQAVKAMRQPGSCITAEKFAQLIMELEELKDAMRSIGTDRDTEKEAIQSLRQQLRRNRRRWELERQFLPLLHQVKGPVGPPSQVKKEAPWATQSAVVAQAPEPERSKSAIDMRSMAGSSLRKRP